ncbi:MAG: DUF4268 domain-containing protein [Bacteroidetes bacterium]|jgi:hypothetical protein|nr:DUF4268 domain-containing protein [Bacteroidota bacterium]
MYSQEQSSAVKQKFWISFGRYMHPVLSAEGNKINWINYRTGIKSVYCKMDATVKNAYIAIEITHKDEAVRALYFNKLKALKQPFKEILEESWIWEPGFVNESGATVARACTYLQNVNVHRESDWPAIISFLKKRIIAIDRFWQENKDVFEM